VERSIRKRKWVSQSLMEERDYIRLNSKRRERLKSQILRQIVTFYLLINI